MNLCIVSFQAVLLAVLVVQNHNINEVEAENLSYVVGNWFNSIERKVDNVQGKIKEAYRRIKQASEDFKVLYRRLIHESFGSDTHKIVKKNENFKKGVEISDLLNSQEQKDLIAVGVLDAVRNWEVKTEAEPEEPQQVIEKQEAPKRKRKMKKHKKRNNVIHEKREHLPHEQRLDASVEKDKAEFSRRVMKKNHKRKEKKVTNQRKFVKTAQKESNSSESDEVNRRKPVDIIVHIKMNE